MKWFYDTPSLLQVSRTYQNKSHTREPGGNVGTVSWHMKVKSCIESSISRV